MDILHPRIFPVDQICFLSRKQKIIMICVNVCQRDLFRLPVNIRFQFIDLLFDFLIIFEYGFLTVPKRFIILHLLEQIKRMIDFQPAVVERAQILHRTRYIFIGIRITGSRVHKFRDLISVFRRNVSHRICDLFSFQRLIDVIFLLAVDHFSGSLPRNTGNIAFSPTGKLKRPVRHSFLQCTDLHDLFCPAVQHISDQ